MILGDGAVALAYVVHQFRQLHALRADGQRAALQPRKFHQVVDQPRKPHDLAQNDVVIAHARVLGRDHALLERLDEGAHGGQRRAHLVGDVGHVVAPRALQPLHLRDVGKQAHRARRGADLVHQRRNDHAQNALRHLQIAGHGLALAHHAVKVRPDVAVGDELQALVARGMFRRLRVEHPFQRGVAVRHPALGVHGHDALGQAVEHLL